MKFIILFFCLDLFLLNFSGQAQNFQGRILYNIQYEDSIYIKNAIFFRTDYPNQMEYIFNAPYFKETWIRPFDQNTIIMYDYRKNEQYCFGLKIKGINKSFLPSLDYSEKYQITPTSEQEVILRYLCDKYAFKSLIGVPGPPKKGYVWVTQKINLNACRTEVNFLDNFHIGIGVGFPLKVMIELEEFPDVWSTITFQAAEIEPKTYDLEEFELPKDLFFYKR